jgi:hypothetical protein
LLLWRVSNGALCSDEHLVRTAGRRERSVLGC